MRLDLTPSATRGGRELLSPDEVARADRFHFEKDRQHYTAARSGMRSILSGYLGLRPQAVRFSYCKHGKPQLAGRETGSSLQFNLSHSDKYAVLAVARHMHLGVDIEYMKPDVAVDEIASSFFSPLEYRTLLALPAEHRLSAFYRCWTRKEAYVKAKGLGLNLTLSSFDVAFASTDPPALLRADASLEEPSRWRVYHLETAPQWVGALVIQGNHHCLIHNSWTVGCTG